MYKLDIEELNINGEPEVVQSFYFEYSQKEEMFKCAFDCKRDYNKITIPAYVLKFYADCGQIANKIETEINME